MSSTAVRFLLGVTLAVILWNEFPNVGVLSGVMPAQCEVRNGHGRGNNIDCGHVLGQQFETLCCQGTTNYATCLSMLQQLASVHDRGW